MFLAQVVNGLLLPVILVFVMLLCHRRDLLGDLASGRLALAVGWMVAVVASAMSIGLVVTYLAAVTATAPPILHVSLVVGGELYDAAGARPAGSTT